jgi:hypothetical protein
LTSLVASQFRRINLTELIELAWPHDLSGPPVAEPSTGAEALR